jgi:hypothetical protein
MNDLLSFGTTVLNDNNGMDGFFVVGGGGKKLRLTFYEI